MSLPDSPPPDSGRAQIRLREDGLHWRVIEGEVLMMDARAGQYVALNRSGATLWDLLVAGTTRANLTERLVHEYGIEPARAARDVEALLDELSARGLLVSRAGGDEILTADRRTTGQLVHAADVTQRRRLVGPVAVRCHVLTAAGRLCA
jgi:hypothetical protein